VHDLSRDAQQRVVLRHRARGGVGEAQRLAQVCRFGQRAPFGERLDEPAQRQCRAYPAGKLLAR
jgi:hypothetical protein